MRKILKKTLALLTARERRLIVPLVVMMFVAALLESLGVTMIIPLVTGFIDMGQVLDSPFGAVLSQLFAFSNERSYLVLIIAVLIAIFIVKNAYLVWQSYIVQRFAGNVRRRIQNGLLRYYMDRPYTYFMDTESGDILRTITVDSDYYFALLNHVLSLFSDLVMLVVMLVVTFIIDAQIMAVLCIIFLVEYLIILKLVKPFLRKYGKRYREALGRGNSQIIELLRGIKFIKVSGKERFFEKRYATEVDGIVESRLVEKAFGGLSGRIIEAMTVSAVLIYLLVLLVSGADLAGLIPTLAALVLAISRIQPRVSGISNAVSYAGYYETSLNRVYDIFEEMEQEQPAPEEGKPIEFTQEILLEGIGFSYPAGEGPVLDGASIAIPRNKAIGIAGPSGSGKTTVADILLGLLQPQEGEVTVDGQPVSTDSPAWRALFAYIPQDIFMLTGTIQDNVVFGQNLDDVDEERVWEALEAAQLADFVRTLKAGLSTEIGEAGVRLSGGQIQRLGIARALYTNAPILVFDEATSALDYETEEALMEAISNLHGEKTMVIIAHRLSTLEFCDVIYQVENGKVLQSR